MKHQALVDGKAGDHGLLLGNEAAVRELGIAEPVFASDIGCYTLGMAAPFSVADYLLSRGSSVGAAGGFDVATDQRVFSLIGDSTFFHAGLSALASAVHNKHRLVLTVLDNRTTATTGHQPNPSMLTDAVEDPAPAISIEAVAKAMGVPFVKVINPYRVAEATETCKEAAQVDGVARNRFAVSCWTVQSVQKGSGKRLRSTTASVPAA
ncbi:MAG: thiamine pyrophosphate-dependent enzyme [Candidatus Cryosericum sp.]